MIEMPMATKPRNAMVGPMMMRRELKMSALNSEVVELPPNIRRKPSTIKAAEQAIRIKLILTRGKCVAFSRRLSAPLLFEDLFTLMLIVRKNFTELIFSVKKSNVIM